MSKLDHVERVSRIAFLKGYIEAVTDFGIWKDGRQTIGCLNQDIKDVLRDYREELKQLEEAQ